VDFHSFNLAFGIKLTASCGRQEITFTAKNMTQVKNSSKEAKYTFLLVIDSQNFTKA
jgi:hypothetical protein